MFVRVCMCNRSVITFFDSKIYLSLSTLYAYESGIKTFQVLTHKYFAKLKTVTKVNL